MGSPGLRPDQARSLGKMIEEWTGIIAGEGRLELLDDHMRPLLETFECEDYRELIEMARSSAAQVRDAIVDAITTNETSWFRDAGLFDELRRRILPELLALRGGAGAGLDIWSAACSTGQEPYTIAMVVHEIARLGEVPGLRPESVRILATDISSEVLAVAEAGRFDQVALGRGLSADLRARYFHEDGRLHRVDPKLRRMIRFLRLNLTEAGPGASRMDLILLRNVLIYFSEERRRAVLEAAHRTLRAGGVLLLGGAETAGCASDLFEAVYAPGAMYYRKRPGTD
ncbi:MAG TPA: protein-glutamate O-methyltransferase CheR [Planctomycetes bacterium]|nr:protein-glutamate O-methyltransferase CheR [Planctomycetota bacterium]